MINPFRLIWCSGICMIALAMSAQSEIEPFLEYDDPQQYEIGGIEVVGNHYSDAKAIVAVSGLKIGNAIQIPGMGIGKAIRSLWRLKLFTDVQVLQTKIVGDVIFLEIRVIEQPRISDISITGVKTSLAEKLQAEVRPFIRKGNILTENMRSNATAAIKAHFVDKGFGDVVVTSSEEQAADNDHEHKIVFRVEPGRKVKVEAITFSGNHHVSAKKLKKLLEIKTKSRLLAPSKLIPSELEQDRKHIIEYYKTLGHLDARIVADSMWREEASDWYLHFTINEGTVYHFGQITWEGNSIYTDEQLDEALNIEKGAVFNQALFDTQLKFSPDGRDISSLYLDHGYLFFRFEPLTQSIRNDTIDLTIKLFEGRQAMIGKVTITGNQRTHEEIIRRELRTIPGRIFSRADIIRSQREIVNLGFFNPETLDIRTNVNPERGYRRYRIRR